MAREWRNFKTDVSSNRPTFHQFVRLKHTISENLTNYHKNMEKHKMGQRQRQRQRQR